jgi:hypothetical protein
MELCEAKSSYVYNLEVYTGAHPTNSEHNTAFSVVDNGVDRSDQMSYYTFAKKTVSGGRNFSFVCST